MQKLIRSIALGILSAVVVISGAALLEAGHSSLTLPQITTFSEQPLGIGTEAAYANALEDLRDRNSVPEETTRIDLDQLLAGGPPKDGIPSVDAPEFDTAATTPFQPSDQVVGLVVNGDVRAYPFNILNWHEIVNDTVGGMNVAVSYCPLCDTIAAFDRGETTFGVSGMLYQSCLVMYDRADDSLFSQPWAQGVVGPQANQTLDRMPAVKTTLGEWLAEYPESLILSTNTGHDRDYQINPYGTYNVDDDLFFPVRNQTQRELHPKAAVSYVWEADDQTPHNQFSGDSHQFIHADIQQMGLQTVEFAGRTIRARWDDALSTVVVEELDGTVVPSSTAFAFVYPAFYGDS